MLKLKICLIIILLTAVTASAEICTYSDGCAEWTCDCDEDAKLTDGRCVAPPDTDCTPTKWEFVSIQTVPKIPDLITKNNLTKIRETLNELIEYITWHLK